MSAAQDESQSALAELAPAVLSSGAKSLYREALISGSLTLAEPHGASSEERRPSAVEELLRLGLIESEPKRPKVLVPVDPRIAEARIGATWRSQALTLLDQATDLSDELAPLIDEFRSHHDHMGQSNRPQRLSKPQDIDLHLGQALAECRQELLTAQPGGGRPAELLQEAIIRDRAVLMRGVTMRTLYQHSAQFDTPTRDYVSEVTSLGAEVRTLDEFFQRLIVVDRRVAFIPAPDSDDEAVVIDDGAVVHYLADVFDRSWQRATAFPADPDIAVARTISHEVRLSIVRLLIEGESETAIARRIGLSKRSCATHIAKLKQQLGADTLFQLGYRVATAELSGLGEHAGSVASSG